MLLRYLFILFIIIPIKAFALIEVDITRGNLNPLPVAVSPLSIDNESKENFKKNNVSLFTLSNYESLIEQALDTNFINQNEATILSKWNSNPSEWTGK